VLLTKKFMPYAPDPKRMSREELFLRMQDAIPTAQEVCTETQAAIAKARETVERTHTVISETYKLRRRTPRNYPTTDGSTSFLTADRYGHGQRP